MTTAHHPTRRHLDAMGGPGMSVPTPEACAARWCDRPAALGLLCAPDGARLADHYGAREGHGQPGRLIHGLPWMWEHIRLAYPSVSGWTSGSGGGDIDDPEAEKLAAVLTLRTDIEDHLTETALDLAERIGRRGPNLDDCAQWARVTRSAGWLLANIEALRSGQGSPAGDEAIAATLAEADDLASRAHALAPWRPAPTRLDGIPCRCGAVGTMHDYGDMVRCWRCGRGYSPEEYTTLMKVLAHRFRDTEGVTA
jgi:hypothetical protein